MNRFSYFWIALLLLFHAACEAEATPPFAAAPCDSKQAKALQTEWADHLGTPVQMTIPNGITLSLIPPGEFTMGSPMTEAGRSERETEHRVRITKPFYLSVHEVTQQQYEKVMGNNPSWFGGLGHGNDRASAIDTSQLPVERVTWHESVAFCRKLSEHQGAKYRLPTEAEWEYACRAGTSTAYSCGNDVRQLPQYAWYEDNSKNTTHPVGKKLPNAWGLFDMHGNVSEWCQDWYARYGNEKVASDPAGPASADSIAPHRVLRSGAFNLQPKCGRAADRYSNLPGYRDPNVGFRLARTIPLKP